jgi:hypothetical protein
VHDLARCARYLHRWFVPRSDVEQVYFDTPYYLYPDGPIAVEGLRVIGAAMVQAGVAGIGRVDPQPARELPIDPAIPRTRRSANLSRGTKPLDRSGVNQIRLTADNHRPERVDEVALLSLRHQDCAEAD